MVTLRGERHRHNGRRAFFGGRGGVVTTLLLCALLFFGSATASVGDRLPEFRECVEVCKGENCVGPDQTPIPLIHRLLLWTCPAECDYTCQHIITSRRLASVPPEPVVQFHGKWPFRRVLGVQEPASVVFSAGNLWAHYDGLHNKILAKIPASYGVRPFYVVLAYISMAAWFFSVVFHTRDFRVTEQLDYFGAGASVLYSLYYTPIRLWRLDLPTANRRSLLRVWTAVCLLMYVCHVAYLKLWTWDYTYNMAANVACGSVQNALWSWFSWRRYRKNRRAWATWPGIVVAWVLMSMSLELLDFPPVWGTFDAHSLWHLGTIAPTVLWYNFLVKDAQDDMAGSQRLKA
ncbi:Per1-like-domain-containing protein [Echria macrotheca]|uniref:Post-GPI attachment to proteins factor 3 n=1 Tax=Echria macrotheca TaxID=438768 RepID=A0AAJ0B6C1_9PEZI|nr:Per1-like-domain-containing protein [Echria macrotheca]